MVKIMLLIALLSTSTLLRAESVKIVYHLHSNNATMFNITVNNLENLLQGMDSQLLDIRLLLQGDSIHLLNPASISENLALRVDNLLQKGVIIETSRNNYQENEFFLNNTTALSLVDNLFSRAVQLQQQGYRYITP